MSSTAEKQLLMNLITVALSEGIRLAAAALARNRDPYSLAQQAAGKAKVLAAANGRAYPLPNDIMDAVNSILSDNVRVLVELSPKYADMLSETEPLISKQCPP